MIRTLKTIACTAVIALLASCKGKPDQNKTTADSLKPVVAKMLPGSTIKLDPAKRYIYLTWDDAPQPPGSVVCKNIFHQEGVKATFFVVGMNQVGPLKKRVADSLRNSYPEFLMANHSYSHANINGHDNYGLFYKQVNYAVDDFLKNEKEMQVPVKIIRLPGNNSWVGKGTLKGPKSTMAVCKRLDSLGFNVIGWDIEWEQNKGTPKESVDAMLQKVNDKFEDGNTFEQNTIVILSHDRLFGKPQYADSLRRFIQVLKQDPRNVFETIDHYPLVQNKK